MLFLDNLKNSCYRKPCYRKPCLVRDACMTFSVKSISRILKNFMKLISHEFWIQEIWFHEIFVLLFIFIFKRLLIPPSMRLTKFITFNISKNCLAKRPEMLKWPYWLEITKMLKIFYYKVDSYFVLFYSIFIYTSGKKLLI